jgi:hypothetical protein
VPNNPEYKYWLQAQIALQKELLKSLKDNVERSQKEGQIALMEFKLSQLRKGK